MNRMSPSTHGPDGAPAGSRDTRGRFAKGNKCGRGNPLAGRAAKIRAVLLRKLTTKQAGEIADVLIRRARDGDLAAIKELLDRTVGRPVPTDVLERLEKLEERLGVDNA